MEKGKSFKWLQFSDLHLTSQDSFDTITARRELLACLKRLKNDDDFKCDYIFFTGDIANRNDYSSTGTTVGEILSILGVPRENCFWAVGNHDIKRGSKIRSELIASIRNSKDPSGKFDEIMFDEECRLIMTQSGMADYIRAYDTLFALENGRPRLSAKEISDAHVCYALEHLNLVVLNTCLASCDNADPYHLMVAERRIYRVFDELNEADRQKPFFVIGHHGKDFLHPAEQEKLAMLFDGAGVDFYFCGHSHRLGYSRFDNTAREIHQLTCGGGVSDDYSVFSFVYGAFDAETSKVTITPYSYSDKGDKTWGVDYRLHRRLKENANTFIIDRLVAARTAQAENKKTAALANDELFNRSERFYTLLHSESGRFSHVEIRDSLFPTAIFETRLNREDEKDAYPLMDILNRLTGEEQDGASDLLIVGEGGMGKTTSLLHIWKRRLADDGERELPLYIPLNDYSATGFPGEDFITRYINAHYQIDLLSLQGTRQKIILLLDGYNEISEAQVSLMHMVKQLRGYFSPEQMRIVITSRHDFIKAFHLETFKLYHLQPLNEEIVKDFLKSMGQQAEDDLIHVLRTPMMLSLYAQTYQIKEKLALKMKRVGAVRFKTNHTKAELLYNYMLCQIANLITMGRPHEILAMFVALFRVAPAVAHYMEAFGKYDISKEDFGRISADVLSARKNSEWFASMPKELQEYCRDNKTGCGFALSFEEALIHRQYLLVKEEGRYTYWHQYFRDFLSAVHIANVVEDSLSGAAFTLPQEVSSRPWPVYIRNMLGEYYGDWRNTERRRRETPLHKLLDRLRGVNHREFGFAVQNILYTWRDARGGRIIGEDVTKLDLTRVPVNGICFSAGHTASHFDRSSFSEITLLPQGHTGIVNSAVYSSDARYILSASHDGTIREWDTETDECVRIFCGHSERVETACYSADGQHILSASWDRTIREWDRHTGECVRTYGGHDRCVQSVVCHPDGQYILSASHDQTIREWDRETGQCLRIFKGHDKPVHSAAYSGDGQRILSASGDQTIREWDRTTGACLRVFNGHTGTVVSACYSPDEQRILSASYDQTIREWDRTTGEALSVLADNLNHVKSAVYSADGCRILSASDDRTIREWDRDTGVCLRVFKGHTAFVESAVYSGDERHVLSASDDGTIREWDRDTGTPLRIWEGNANVGIIAAYSADDTRVLSVYQNKYICEWNRKTKTCLSVFEGHSNYIRSAIYSPDERYILSASYDQTIREWDRNTGECRVFKDAHPGAVNSAVYSADGRRILSASWDNVIREWDRATGACLHVFKGHTKAVFSAIYSADGERILSASYDHTIREWDRDTETCLCVYTGHAGTVKSAIYSSDESRVLSASYDDTIREWDRATGQCLRVFQGHSHHVTYAMYNADERYVLSASNDGTVREWFRDTGKCHRVFRGHSGIVRSVTYSSDEQRILSASFDGTIREWDRETEQCLWATLPYGGILIAGCSFKGCEFQNNNLEDIVKAFGGKLFRAFISGIGSERRVIALDTADMRHLLVTGPNGSGKTSFLNDLYASLRQMAAGKDGAHTLSTVIPRFPDSDTATFSDDFTAEVNFAGENTQGQYKIRYFKAARTMSEEPFFAYVSHLHAMYQNAQRNNDAEKAAALQSWFDRLEKTLQGLFGDRSITLACGVSADGGSPEVQLHQSGSPLNRRYLPHGYIAALDIMGQLMHAWGRTDLSENRLHGLVLIDEPETHLHVHMQKNILPCLIGQFPHVQFIAATHSPFVLNSVERAIVYDMETEERYESFSEYPHEE